MDINEGKVPGKDAIPRKAQDSADYNQSPAFCASPARALSAELLSGLESSLNQVREGPVW